MSSGARDGADRLLATATRLLPQQRRDWGAAMRAELSSIEDPTARARFARSASLSVLRLRFGLGTGLGVLAAALVSASALAASRVQLESGGPGLLGVTVPVPALVLLLTALAASGRARSFAFGVKVGAFALATSAAALLAVLALEGPVWMERRGVFLLDGDPPGGVVGTPDVVGNVLSSGLWVGHAVVWLAAMVAGAGLGACRPAAATSVRASVG